MRRCVAALGVLFATMGFSARAQFVPLAPPPSGVIVRFDERVSMDMFRRDLRALSTSKGVSGEALPEIRREYSRVLHGVALQTSQSTLAALRALPYVRAIDPDMPVRALGMPATEAGSMRSAALGRGDGVTVAVIDTGIDYTHPALGGGFGPGFKVAEGYDFVNGDDDPRDDNGHGTHVAGIIAAEGEEMTGLAPDVTLFAYKVLDASGSGRQSDVIAALERAVDPNGDGDTSDHATVINLSLGGMGTPDDPQSLAVDAAVAMGAVVAVAAGNEGDFFAILSPGTSRLAVTVGAVASDHTIPWFSSRGPCAMLATIKPDLVAPGVAVRSTFLGGTYSSLDGTSMAAPHVAAASALIRSAHPAWTPAQVKAALTMTATRIDAGAMAQGAGILDLVAAMSTPLVASVSHFDFGLDAEQEGAWTRSRSIVVTNVSKTPRVYGVSASSGDAVVVRVTPESLMLAPGASASITLGVTVDNAAALADAQVTRDGIVTLTGRTESAHFAWAVVTASRAVFTAEQSIGHFYILSPTNMRQPRWVASNAAEIYVAPGTYDVAAIGYDWTMLATHVSFVVTPRVLAGDVTIRVMRSEAKHTIEMCGARGMEPYLGRFRIDTPAPMKIRGFDVQTSDGTLSTSDLSSEFHVKGAEVGVDSVARRVVAISYPAVRGMTRDAILEDGAPNRHRMRFVHATPARRQVSIRSLALDSESNVVAGTFCVTSSDWILDVYANEEPHDDHIMALEVTVGELGHAPDVSVSGLRVRDHRFIVACAAEPSPFAPGSAAGDETTYGAGAAIVAPHVVVATDAVHMCARVIGAGGESRPRSLELGLARLFDASGSVIAERAGDGIDASLAVAGRATLELSTPGLQWLANFDTTYWDALPATITSIAVVDASGRIAPALRYGEEGALVFTAADPDARGLYQSIRGEETRAWARVSGTTEWQSLIPVAMDDDCGLTTTPFGLRYRAALSAVTAHACATIDVRIAVSDWSGNTSVLTVMGAFSVSDVPERRRAVAHR